MTGTTAAIARCFTFIPFLLSILAILPCDATIAQMEQFIDNDPQAKNLGIWRLTHDPAVRDHANYHSIQCWSPNGRYICYTHFTPGLRPRQAERLTSEIHVFDLNMDRDIYVDRGTHPRWARRHNWLFYVHYNSTNKPSFGQGTSVIRMDMDSGKKEIIAHGVELLGETDAQDRWLYGNQRFRHRQPEYNTVRMATEPGGSLEILSNVIGTFPNVNPHYPVVAQRAVPTSDFSPDRVWFDLDGRNLRIGTIKVELAHTCWLGNGEYFLIGNDYAKGRRWDEPFPSNIHYLANCDVGDISPCGISGRYLCGGDIKIVDLRSGDGWQVVSPRSQICYPAAIVDESGPNDADPKGSPDGTKICFVSTYDLKHGPWTRLTERLLHTETDKLAVESTEGFLESGRLVLGREVIAYEKRTDTTFEGLTRKLYDTLCSKTYISQEVTLFEARMLNEAERKRQKHPPSYFYIHIPDADSPLRWQRQTDVYVVVARLPNPPHLRLKGDRVELIPGENHRETAGYLIFDETERIEAIPVGSNEMFQLPGAGTYTAAAMEVSGLQSKPSLPLTVERSLPIAVLAEAPTDFSWTQTQWFVDDQEVPEAKARQSPHAQRRTVHLHDGLIGIEFFEDGQVVGRHDLNAKGEATRQLVFKEGRLALREYYRNGRKIVSEIFGPDGFKNETIKWAGSKRNPHVWDHWWYGRGVPVKRLRPGRELYIKEGENWIKKPLKKP